MKKIFTSASMGVLALMVVSFTAAYTGVTIPISPLSLTVGSVLGIPGVITMLVMNRIII